MSDNARRVLSAICKFADADGRCYPSYARLSEETGLLPPRISAAVGKLVAVGLIVVEPQRGQRGRYRYQVIFDAPVPDPNWRSRNTGKRDGLLRPSPESVTSSDTPTV